MVSVVIPLYNKEPIIERTVNSVLSQSFNDFEVIVVDDGSTDGSVAVVESIHDERIRLIRQENGGPSKARNTGVEHARGKWIVFLDADDELADGALQHLADVAARHPERNVIDGSFMVRTEIGEQPHRHKDGWLVSNNFKAFFYRDILPSTGHTLFRTDLLRKYPYDTRIRRYEDVELLMRLLRVAKVVTTSRIIFYVNAQYSAASTARQTIAEDFLGYLDFQGKTFWERICLYQLYLWERDHYRNDVDRLYPTLRRRYDLMVVYKVLNTLRQLHII